MNSPLDVAINAVQHAQVSLRDATKRLEIAKREAASATAYHQSCAMTLQRCSFELMAAAARAVCPDHKPEYHAPTDTLICPHCEQS